MTTLRTAVRPAATAGSRTSGTEVVAGRRPVLAGFPRLERLARDLDVPATGRTAWLRAQLDAEPGARPWAVRVVGAGSQLLAEAVVLESSSGRVRLAGGGGDHPAAVVAVDEDSARTLGRALASEFQRRHLRAAPAALRDDAVTAALADGAGGELTPAEGVPAFVPDRGDRLAAHLPHGMLRTLRKARNRMDADGRRAEITVSRRDEDVVRVLPALEQVYRERDEQHGLCSELDTARGLATWRARIDRLLDDRCLELAALTVDGELAAYVLGIVDGRWYRILDGRMVARFARYAPGRVVEAAVVDRALAAGHVGVDWMTAVAPETLLAATTVQPVVTLTWKRAPTAA